MPNKQYLTIDPDRTGQRIDNFLIAYFKLPKPLIYRWLRKGELRVNNIRTVPAYKLQAGEILRIPPFTTLKEKRIIPVSKKHLQYLKSSIIYEDNNYIVLNKPSGIAVHGGSGINSGLIERLRLLRPDEKKLELVHRLDKETSGCLIFAKKYNVLVYFHKLFKNQQIKKSYHAFVHGRWPKKITTINLPLKKYVLSQGERIVRVSHSSGKDARTTIQILKYFKNYTLLKVLPSTGRTHQIRVHLAAYNHPIICDKKYGSIEQNDEFYKAGFKRLFLHANSLEFKDPITNERVNIKSSYDSACKKLLSKLHTIKY